jgi:hypothetical protein
MLCLLHNHVNFLGNYLFFHELQRLDTFLPSTTNYDTRPHELPFCTQNPHFVSQRPILSVKGVNLDGLPITLLP